jgi:hypothetical protein
MARREPRWHTGSYSGASGSCVEVAEGRTAPVPDTQNRELGRLDHTPEAWTAFLRRTTLTNS